MLSTPLISSLIAAFSVAATPTETIKQPGVQPEVQHVAVLATFADANASRVLETSYCEYVVEQNPGMSCTSLRSIGDGIDVNDGQAFVELAQQENADHLLFISWTGLSYQPNPAVLRFTEVSPERAHRAHFGISRNGCYINRYKNEFSLSLVSLHNQQLIQAGEIDTYGMEHTGVRNMSYSIARRIDDSVKVAALH
ncbi:hypothetical protein [Aliidiomarina soli]|uniref:Uncharacterized protein n=1 Tax=Aliidiomarina soli TaxID=1928574 RepID=A0A432WJT2_9GAMM|nr:hypothetical protein [Aliidiomarina soli]RUO34043.1 hypothetical protein CWE14_06250 [Aliidiomarina soli]